MRTFLDQVVQDSWYIYLIRGLVIPDDPFTAVKDINVKEMADIDPVIAALVEEVLWFATDE
ncbi:MAG: hypothetical protein RL059_1252 [Bacteroidota bacterium]